MADNSLNNENEATPLPLPTIYQATPLDALNVSTRKKLEKSLKVDVHSAPLGENSTGNSVLTLASLVLTPGEVTNLQQKDLLTVTKILDCWQEGSLHTPATVGQLYYLLMAIHRQDVLRACRTNIENDCKLFTVPGQRPRQPDRVESYPDGQPLPEMPDDNALVTTDDVDTNCITKYYAFVSYVPEDTNFVMKMIREVERKKGLKLYVPGRDDMPGLSKHSTNALLIEKRCTRLVMVMSNAFLKCSDCDFQLRFAHSICPGARGKKMVPVIIEPIAKSKYPNILLDLCKCDFTREHIPDEWKWEQLVNAVKAQPGTYKLFEEEEGSETAWHDVIDDINPCMQYPRLPRIPEDEGDDNNDTKPANKSPKPGLFNRILRKYLKKKK